MSEKTVVEQLVKDVASQLQMKNQTLSVAESCTGGLLSAQITNLAGVSSIYLGSVVSYANEVKTSVLGVSETTIKTHGAVSRESAKEMASGVRLKLRSDWSVAITGIAGPSGGTLDKPVGTVFIAVVGPNIEVVELQNFNGDRQTIRMSSVTHALNMLKKALSQT